MNILLICGESGVGKSTIAYELSKDDKYSLVRSITDRPQRPQEIDHILANMGMSRIDISKDLQEGKRVKIVDGPFKDMEAKIDNIDLKEQKLMVLVDLFGQETSVEVEISQVEGI